MHRKLRLCLGWLLMLTPPYTGLWLFYSWCFTPEQDYHRRKLINYFSVPRAPNECPYGTFPATWETPFGKCILWQEGHISLHTDNKCIMSDFAGGIIDHWHRQHLRQLVAASAYPNKLTKYDFVTGGFIETLSLFIAKCRDFVEKVLKSPRQG